MIPKKSPAACFLLPIATVPSHVHFQSHLLTDPGSFRYNKTFGYTSMKPENAKPLRIDTVMWVASCTKLMTSICALQLVERGKLTLDNPVYDHIPELKDFKILRSFDKNGEPIEVQHTKSITLRTLLTHTSGLTYDSMHPKLLAWLAYHGRKSDASANLLQRFNAPLIFEPGASWMYGPSIDYVGLLIERVTGQTLEEFMRQNLWEPLSIKDMTFKLSSRPDMKERMADMSTRDEKTGKVRHTRARMPYLGADGEEVQDCMGGQGVFTTVEEYSKILKAVLTMDENEKLLKKDTVKEFFTPQLGVAPSTAMNAIVQDDTVRAGILSPNRADFEFRRSTTQWVAPRKSRGKTGALEVFFSRKTRRMAKQLIPCCGEGCLT